MTHIFSGIVQNQLEDIIHFCLWKDVSNHQRNIFHLRINHEYFLHRLQIHIRNWARLYGNHPRWLFLFPHSCLPQWRTVVFRKCGIFFRKSNYTWIDNVNASVYYIMSHSHEMPLLSYHEDWSVLKLFCHLLYLKFGSIKVKRSRIRRS